MCFLPTKKTHITCRCAVRDHERLEELQKWARKVKEGGTKMKYIVISSLNF